MSDPTRSKAKKVNVQMNEEIECFLDRLRDQYGVHSVVLIFDYRLDGRTFGSQSSRGDVSRCFHLAHLAANSILMNETEVIARG